MSRYSTILFDLDGTLLATKRGVIASVAKTFDELSYKLPPDNKLDGFMGPPLDLCFIDVCGLTPEQAETAIKTYRRIYEESGLFDADVYEGIPQLLCELKAKGYKLGVATSKYLRFALDVLKHFGLYDYFDAVCGEPANNSKWTKKDSILSCIAQIDSAAVNNTVLIGDRKFDAVGAKEAGIDSIGVLYGYGSYEELSESSFCSIAKTVDEFATLLV